MDGAKMDRLNANNFSRIPNPFISLKRYYPEVISVWESDMSVNGKTAIVIGGSRGLGQGVAHALAENGARVTSISRGAAALKDERGIGHRVGDVVDEALAKSLIAELKPDIVVVSAGAIPKMMPINSIDWNDFSKAWHVDVKGALGWIQAALAAPMAPGSRVLFLSSGAAINGSPLSGGYAGAKRMVWLMADYAQKWADRQKLDITFQTIIPHQMFGDTGIGDAGAAAYSTDQVISKEVFLGRFGKALLPLEFGRHVVNILENDDFLPKRAFTITGDKGIAAVEASKT
jgi:NAD(P)-dependent dehydrogenase (short-subunit alcohol dehydrogenase family)